MLLVPLNAFVLYYCTLYCNADIYNIILIREFVNYKYANIPKESCYVKNNNEIVLYKSGFSYYNRSVD